MIILKNIITPEDWEIMSEHIQYDFLYDNHFSELKETELFNERINVAATAEPYIGKYYSQDYVRRRILRQTDEEILEEDKKIEQEIADGIIPDPSIPIDPETGMPIDPMAMEGESDLGAPVADPDLEGESLSPAGKRELPKGGEI
jgi:hypothetical protein